MTAGYHYTCPVVIITWARYQLGTFSWELAPIPRELYHFLGISTNSYPVVIITWVRYQLGTLLHSTREEKVEKKSDGGDSRE